MKKIHKVLAISLLAPTLLTFQDSQVTQVQASDVTATVSADKTFHSRGGAEFEAGTFARQLKVGDQGQIKRPQNTFLKDTQYSFEIIVADPSILTFDETGHWQALKAGKTNVIIGMTSPVADTAKSKKFAAELAKLKPYHLTIEEVAVSFEVEVTENTSPNDLYVTMPMNRLYNPNSGEHFYTAKPAERDHLVRLGWRHEGIGWEAPQEGQAVHRLYNPNAGDHHYTTSSQERDHLVKVGWRYEGEGWKSGGTVPVYRLYNPNAKMAGAHHYTTSAGERNALVKLGWRDEGIGWYAMR